MIDDRPVMLVSQPNAGSTWFASCLTADPNLIDGGFREFFNPASNRRHYYELRMLGSELYETVDHLSIPRSQDMVDQIVASTWATYPGLTFTKEVFIAFNLPAFLKHFRAIVLVRGLRSTFPPGRIRVMVWYSNWYWSLLRSGWLKPGGPWLASLDQRDHTPEVRAVIAWQVVRWTIQRIAQQHALPSYNYEWLMEADQHALTQLLGERVSEAIVHTRKYRREPTTLHQRQWARAYALLDDFRETVGDVVYDGLPGAPATSDEVSR